MKSVSCYDTKTKKNFTKEFDNIVEQRRFIIRCDKGNRLIITSYTWDSEDEYEYLVGGR